MEEFLMLSAIYLFAPLPEGREDPDELRRALKEKMNAAIGEIRKLSQSNLYPLRLIKNSST